MPIDSLVIAGVFVLAGAIKGVIGLGLPSVALGLLTAVFGLEAAMALMLAPSFATNLWQACVGGNGGAVLRRAWPFFLFATGSVAFGAWIALGRDAAMLSALLGFLLVGYGATALTRPALKLPRRWEPWAGTAAGIANGILTGMTGSFVVPGVMYLQALALPRDALVQAMGILFTLSTLALAVAMSAQGRLSVAVGATSVLAIVPAVLGMVAGQVVRRRLSEATFRRVFFWSLIALGGYILARALAGDAG